jgi:lambda repressor-like predicted transcriptional regulator
MSRDITMVELLLRYSNLSDQGNRIGAVLAMTPTGSPAPVPRHKQRRLRAQTADLVASYQAGATVYELASQYQIKRQTVSNILERQGVPRRYLRLTGNALNEAVKVYEAGSSLSELSRELGLPVTTIRLALMRAGVTLRKRPGWKY